MFEFFAKKQIRLQDLRNWIEKDENQAHHSFSISVEKPKEHVLKLNYKYSYKFPRELVKIYRPGRDNEYARIEITRASGDTAASEARVLLGRFRRLMDADRNSSFFRKMWNSKIGVVNNALDPKYDLSINDISELDQYSVRSEETHQESMVDTSSGDVVYVSAGSYTYDFSKLARFDITPFLKELRDEITKGQQHEMSLKFDEEHHGTYVFDAKISVPKKYAPALEEQYLSNIRDLIIDTVESYNGEYVYYNREGTDKPGGALPRSVASELLKQRLDLPIHAHHVKDKNAHHKCHMPLGIENVKLHPENREITFEVVLHADESLW